MANKSSSVFGGPTTRWELGGNPNQTMFSKPKPQPQPQQPVHEKPEPVALAEPLPEVINLSVETPKESETVSQLFTSKPKKEKEEITVPSKLIIDLDDIKAIYTEYCTYKKELDYCVVLQGNNTIYVNEQIGQPLYTIFLERVRNVNSVVELNANIKVKITKDDEE